MVTIKDIARLTGTSVSAVSYVLNHKYLKRVKPAKRDAILKAVQQYGYRQNLNARGLKLQCTFQIAICLQGQFHQYPIMGNYSFYETISQTASQLDQQGYRTPLIQINPRESPKQMLESLGRTRADGYLFINWNSDLLQKIFTLMDRDRLPAVSLGTALDTSCSWSAMDQAGSFRAGTEHLLRQGRRQIVVLDFDLPANVYHAERLAGYQEAMRAAGLEPLPPAWIRPFTISGAFRAVAELRAARPDLEAIFLTDNYLAPVILQALNSTTVQVLGYGDAGPTFPCDPPLSYAQFPIEAMVTSAIRMMLDQIHQGPAYVPRQTLHLCRIIQPAPQ